MSLLGGWILAPAVLVVLCAGCGLAAEAVARRRLPGALLLPVGMSVLIAVAGLFVLTSATAPLAAPAVTAVAIAGVAIREPWRDPRLRALWPWPLLLALSAYAVYAAPSLLSGQGSITGYVKLDDSATWLALTDRVLSHGRDLSGVPTGSYDETLKAWLGGDYPVGAFLPLGIAAKLAGVDPASSYQATIAVYATTLALGLHACVRRFAGSAPAAAGAAFVAVQASLMFGYANWGGIKEVAAAALLPPLAWLAVEAWRRDGAAYLAMLCAVAGAALGVLGVNGMAWAGPALAIGAVGWWRGGARSARSAAAAVVTLGIGALPALATFGFVRNTTQGAISAQADLGNLAKPLPLLQGGGLWPVGDLRVDPHPRALAILLALACLGALYAAVARGVQRREWALPALVAIAFAGAIPAVAVGAPWIDAKALAILSPFVLLAAAARVVTLPRPFAAIAAVPLVAATAWSTQLVTRDVFVAPRGRLAELAKVAKVAVGPVVVLDFEIYADRHFLRDLGGDGATDLRARRVARTDGSLFPGLSTAEVDEIAPAELWAFQSILRRRNPIASRPPSAFRLVWAGDAFELWQRPVDAAAPITRLPLSEGLDPTATAACRQLAPLAKLPGVGTLAAVERPAPVIADLASQAVPPPWHVGDSVVPVVDGTAVALVTVPQAGVWRVYVGGSTLGRLEVRVDGHPVGVKRHELAHDGQWLRYGAVQLAAGDHDVQMRYSAGPPQAGIGEPSPLGPVALAPEAAEGDLPVTRVPAAKYRQLCDGRRLDWVEALP